MVHARVRSYRRLFYHNGFINVADLKIIRNEMDLLVRRNVCTVQAAGEARKKLIATFLDVRTWWCSLFAGPWCP
jgi:hypothetical protein